MTDVRDRAEREFLRAREQAITSLKANLDLTVLSENEREGEIMLTCRLHLMGDWNEQVKIFLPTDFPYVPPKAFYVPPSQEQTPKKHWNSLTKEACLRFDDLDPWSFHESAVGDWVRTLRDWFIETKRGWPSPDLHPVPEPLTYRRHFRRFEIKPAAEREYSILVPEAIAEAPLTEHQGFFQYAVVEAHRLMIIWKMGETSVELNKFCRAYGLSRQYLDGKIGTGLYRVADQSPPRDDPLNFAAKFFALNATQRDASHLDDNRKTVGLLCFSNDGVRDWVGYVRVYDRPAHKLLGRQCSRHKQHGLAPVHPLRQDIDLYRRLSGCLEPQRLRSKRVLIIGLGSLGSTVAVELSRAGIGHFHLIDRDFLEVGNVMRHECDHLQVGTGKALAVAHLLQRRNPAVVVEPRNADIQDGPFRETLKLIIRSSDIVIDATGSQGIARAMNRLCLTLDKPLCYGWVTPGGVTGLAGVVIPGKTPCLECLFQNKNCQTILLPVYKKAEAIFPQGCDQPTFPGAGIDLRTVALEMARMAINILSGGATIWAETGWLRAWRGCSSVDLVSGVNEIEIAHPYSWQEVPAQRNPACHFCGDEENDQVSVAITSQAKQEDRS